MFDILSITLPIFSIILVGYVIVRFGPLTSGHMRALGEFTMLVSLPCALFHAVATRSFGEVVNPSYLITLALAGLASQATIWTVVRFQNVGPMRRALGVLSAATPNTAFLGYPIFLLVIPEHAGPVVAMNLLIENLLLTPIGLLLIGRADSQGQAISQGRLFLRTILSVLRRPLIIGLLLGFAVLVLGVSPPEELTRFTALLGQAAAPVALVVIGGSLVGLNLRGDLSLAAQIAAVKMIVHPAMVALVLSGLAIIGLPHLDRELVVGALLTASLPMFASFILFGQEAGHEGLASLAVMISTCLSFATINLALLILL